ncbi:MAG TPA: beta-galactosidase [Candidatus Dormibacteraeota bacterium]|nr:beta-galactosidase [Candidatus Dormibacteraeota bacterium]
MAYGGDYNPDQWPEETWAEDIRLMREAHVNLVSVAIFSWSRIQPTADTWDFEWLDRIMGMLDEGDIRVDLATATASPPPWLSHAHPEMLPVLADGTRLWHGARQQYCPSSPVYRAAAKQLVEKMAERYAKHPALALWHVGNEYGCHVPACYCDVSAAAFRDWLRNRYGSLDELNDAWGTSFWSQRYSAWDEVIPPRRTPTWPNPSQQLDFFRFSSDALLECYDLEHEVLKRVTPDVPVTTNFMSFFKPLDYWKWAAQENFVSNDSYPDPSDPASPMRAAMAGDLMRSLGHGRPWILMEQTTSRVNWRDVNVPKPPGVMRLWCYQAMARGADGIMFFQWRQSRAGAEKFHSAMVPHGPVDESPVWHEVVQLGGELSRLESVGDSRGQARIALLLDWESWWALELPSKPSNRVQQVAQIEAFYRPLYEANFEVDFAHPEDDLRAYQLVIAPSLYMVSDKAVANLEAFVRGGGTLAMSYFSGIVDPSDHVRLGGYPQPFRHVLGLNVVDFHPLREGQHADLRFESGESAHGEIWSELIEVTAASPLATFAGSSLAGRPAITRNRFGQGTALYLGTLPDGVAMARTLRDACSIAHVEPAAQLPQGVEAVRRYRQGKSILFLLNHRDVAVEVPIGETGTNMIDGSQVHRGLMRLGPRGVAIVKEGW